ncbi:MAG: hypothetical protein SXG53_15070 [Pseudomonadota bacterium]|nr:hypothetical protein [Pseudomonadota bacterium]
MDPSILIGEVAPDDPGANQQETNSQNKLRFFSLDNANEFSRRLQERLADPEQRVALRAEQRAALLAQNSGVGRVVGLDPSLEQQLIELLTDLQMEQLEQSLARPDVADLQHSADQVTQRMNALHELLGDDKLERFQAFEMDQSGRHWVGQLSARLAPADRLQPDQEDRLIALKQQQFWMTADELGSWRAFRRPRGQLLSLTDMQRESQRQGRLANENSWRKRQVENRAIEQKAAAFLTSTQLAELSKYHAQEQDNLRGFVESARARAGLDPRIPEQPELVEETLQLIDVEVQVEVNLSVNREPRTVTRKVRNGSSFTFEAAPGLVVEARPMMYELDWIDVHLKFYEEGAAGRRRLSGGLISNAQMRQSDGSLAAGGSGGTVIAGRKGYAVESSINAKVL